MQSSVFKNICFLLFLGTSLHVNAQSLTYHLSKADSLFQQKRYTQSLELYESIFKQKQFTPAMLLKMAFIEEGLDHIPKAMYYLNMYHMVTRDDRVLAKINDVAKKHGLDGYTISDTDQVIRKYHEYHLQITAIIVIMIFAISAFVFFRRKNEQPIMGWLTTLFLLAALAIHVNLQLADSMAIISRSNCYLMNGPSAGASVLQIINEGHRVKITGREDVWVKVKINAKEGYLKEDNLLILSL